jgi:hypothetical protein
LDVLLLPAVISFEEGEVWVNVHLEHIVVVRSTRIEGTNCFHHLHLESAQEELELRMLEVEPHIGLDLVVIAGRTGLVAIADHTDLVGAAARIDLVEIAGRIDLVGAVGHTAIAEAVHDLEEEVRKAERIVLMWAWGLSAVIPRSIIPPQAHVPS